MKIEFFLKWYIFWMCYFPENLSCKKCNENLDQLLRIECPNCNTTNKISNIIPKPRPVVLWIDKPKWCDNITFGIPLSTDIEHFNYYGKYNHLIKLDDYEVADDFQDKKEVLRAIINQASRIDGNCINKCKFFGQLKDETTKEKIENKLRKWLNL